MSLQFSHEFLIELQHHLNRRDYDHAKVLLSVAHKIPEQNIDFVRRNGREEVRISENKEPDEANQASSSFIKLRDQYRSAGWKTQFHDDDSQTGSILYISPPKE